MPGCSWRQNKKKKWTQNLQFLFIYFVMRFFVYSTEKILMTRDFFVVCNIFWLIYCTFDWKMINKTNRKKKKLIK